MHIDCKKKPKALPEVFNNTQACQCALPGFCEIRSIILVQVDSRSDAFIDCSSLTGCTRRISKRCMKNSGSICYTCSTLSKSELFILDGSALQNVANIYNADAVYGEDYRTRKYF